MQARVNYVGSSNHTGVLMPHLYNQRRLPHNSYQFFRLEASGYKVIKVVLLVGPLGTTKRYIQNILRSYNISTTLPQAELPHHCNRKRTTSSSLPLSREVLLDYTNLVSELFKLYIRQRFSQYIKKLFLCRNILDIYNSLLHHILNVVIANFNMFPLIMRHQVLCFA